SPANRTIQMFPIGNVSGDVPITIYAHDTLATNESATTFTLTLTPSPGGSVRANVSSIIYRGNPTNNAFGPGLYPSEIFIPAGTLPVGIYNVTVTLNGLTNVIPHNLDIALVAPTSVSTNTVMLTSGAGPTTPANDINFRWVFDDLGG